MWRFFYFYMMKKLWPIAIIAALGIYFSQNLKSFFQSTSVQIGKITFNRKRSQGTVFTRLFFDVMIRVQNRSNIQGKINGGQLNFTYNDKLIATVNDIGSFALNAGGETVFPIGVAVQTLSLFPSIAQAIQTLKVGGQMKLRVTGEIITSVGNIKVDETKVIDIA